MIIIVDSSKGNTLKLIDVASDKIAHSVEWANFSPRPRTCPSLLPSSRAGQYLSPIRELEGQLTDWLVYCLKNYANESFISVAIHTLTDKCPPLIDFWQTFLKIFNNFKNIKVKSKVNTIDKDKATQLTITIDSTIFWTVQLMKITGYVNQVHY